MHHDRRSLYLAFSLLLGGCATIPVPGDDEPRYKMLALLMPSRIEIVEPFTRVRTVEDRATPAAVEILLQTFNSMDDPGLMVVGNIRIELYEYVQASGDQKGKLLDHWNVELATAKDQRRYWNELTQMYEFRIGISPKAVTPAERYVLLVTYDSPLGERLTDEFVLRLRPGPNILGQDHARN